MSIPWVRCANPAITADYVVEDERIDPHEVANGVKCPRCGGRLTEWPGTPIYLSGGALIHWQQRHGCGAWLRVLADLREVDAP